MDRGSSGLCFRVGRAATELEPILDKLVFVGGATVPVWIIVDVMPDELRRYVSREVTALLDQPRFIDALDGTVNVGRARSGAELRVDRVVLPRLRALAEPPRSRVVGPS